MYSFLPHHKTVKFRIIKEEVHEQSIQQHCRLIFSLPIIGDEVIPHILYIFILAWDYNTRLLTLHFPDTNYIAWSDQIISILTSAKTSTMGEMEWQV